MRELTAELRQMGQLFKQFTLVETLVPLHERFLVFNQAQCLAKNKTL